MLRKNLKSVSFKKREDIKYKKLTCEKCGAVDEKVEESITAVTCHVCCAHMGPIMSTAVKAVATGPKRPKGWRFMKVYVDEDTTVFHKGVEQPELKGTLPVTVIEPKEKKSSFQREQEKAAKEEKQMIRLAKKHAKKQEAKKQEAAETAALPV